MNHLIWLPMSRQTDVTLRRLSATDIPVIAGFEAEIAEISFPDDPVTDLGFYSKKLNAAIQDRKSWPLVAELGGQIVGWAWFFRRENFVTGEVYADLRSFYVVSGKRGGGAAFKIMRKVIAECRKLGLARLVGRTSSANHAMQALYSLYGYEPKHIVYELDLAGVEDARPKAAIKILPPINFGRD